VSDGYRSLVLLRMLSGLAPISTTLLICCVAAAAADDGSDVVDDVVKREDADWSNPAVLCMIISYINCTDTRIVQFVD